MLKKLEHDALTADLVAVESLLASRTEEDDPIGFIQYSSRKAALEEKLRRLDQRMDRHAELGIFFGGGQVQGSRGINADFAGKALDEIQALITKRYSEVQVGGLRQRGRLPLMDRSKMMLTSMVRGSIGFVLEEAGDAAEIVDTPLRTVVDEVSDILVRIGADDEAVAPFEVDTHARARGFLLLKITRHLLGVVNPRSSWPERMKSHLQAFPDLAHLGLNLLAGMGAPRHWEADW